MSRFIHATADVQTQDIGEGTRIWLHCIILPGTKTMGIRRRAFKFESDNRSIG